jgi:TatD DNase family protein
MFFDMHCHLQDIKDDIGTVIRRAADVGVEGMLCCGTSPADWEHVAELADTYSAVIPAFGLHPWYVAEAGDDWLHKLRGLLERYPDAVVGEIGIDRSRRRRADGAQVDAFLSQLWLAKELDRAVSVHCVRGWGLLKDALQQIGSLPAGIVLHSFSGGAELVQEFTSYNVLFSFSGLNVGRGTAAMAAVPDDLLLLESDAPYGIPTEMERLDEVWGEPACLPLLAEFVAKVRGTDVGTVEMLVSANTERLRLCAGITK